MISRFRAVRNRTSLYEQAVASLSGLAEAEGLEAAGQAAAEGNDVQYSYDLKGRLTKASYEDPIPFDMMEEDRVQVVIEYDGLGRHTRVLNDNDTAVLRWQYDRLGKVTKLQYANNDAETYLYDIAGQRTKLTRPTGQLITYLYDARGGLTKTTLPGSVNQVYQYDAAVTCPHERYQLLS